MLKPRKSSISRTESAGSADNHLHDALVRHITEVVDKTISENPIRCNLKSLWLLIQKNNIGADYLYNTLCKMLYNTGKSDNSCASGENTVEKKLTDIESCRTSVLYLLKYVAKGYKICNNLSSSRMPSELIYRKWSRYYRDFEEISIIAEGATGKVYKVRNRWDGTEYAIKKEEFDWSTPFMRAIAEVKIHASLNHHGVVNLKNSWLEPLLELPETYVSPRKRMKSSDSNNNSNLSPNYNKFHMDVMSPAKENISPDLCNNMDFEMLSSIKPRGVILYMQMSHCQQTLRQWLDDRKQNMTITKKHPEIAILPHTESAGYVPATDMAIVVDIFKQLVEGLHHIHLRGITHGDIKADNVLITRCESGYSVQLCDFDLSNPSRHPDDDELDPEIPWHDPFNTKNDMVNLGAILLEMLDPCKTDRERRKTIDDLENGRIPPSMDPHFARIIAKLVHESPSQRYDTAQLLEELSKLLKNKDHIIKMLMAENVKLKMELSAFRS